MPTSLNSLLVAWAITLIIVLGGALYLQLTFNEADYQTEGVSDTNTSSDNPESDTSTADEEEDGAAAVVSAGAGSTDSTATAIQINAFNSDLAETIRDGDIPVIAADGRRPVDYYASKLPQPASVNLKKIAIVVTDVGRISRTTNLALDKLPAAVTLAFSPYAAELSDISERARVKGHESLLMIPMEPLNYPQNDPGPLALLTSNTGRQNTNLVRTVLARMTGYVGTTNFMGARFTASADSIRPVLEDLKGRGLMFVDARTSQFSRAAQISSALNMPTALNNGFVDETPNRNAIENELSKLENRARTLGAAVGFTRLYPVSIDTVADWATDLEDRGFVLVPITRVADTQPLR